MTAGSGPECHGLSVLLQNKRLEYNVMLHFLLSEKFDALLAPGGIIFAFVATVFAISKLADKLPRDAGRAYAHNGKLSAGKPRGAGVIFVPAFVLAALV